MESRGSKNLSGIFSRLMDALDSMIKPGAYPQNEVSRLAAFLESGASRTCARAQDVSPLHRTDRKIPAIESALGDIRPRLQRKS
jgi:hypothetical protein